VGTLETSYNSCDFLVSLQPGARLGPYEIQSAIGAGGMGEVYKARDTRLDRVVAIKILPEALAADSQFRGRFDREARVISQLDHPHICAVYDVGEQHGTAYLVMQYLEGETLADRLRKGPLSTEIALQIAVQISQALVAAHRSGIVHRDLKPANIMLTRSGAKLLDFGLAKLRDHVAVSMSEMTRLATAPPNTAQGMILGTVHYMSPEQVEGREADERSDLWALGAVLYEMLTGRRPFDGASPASVIGAILKDIPPPVSIRQPLVPVALDHVIETCLAKDPDERWQSVADVGRELQWIASAPPTTRPALSAWRERAVWITVSAALAGVAVFGSLWRRPAPVVGDPILLSVNPPEGTVFSGGMNVTLPVPEFALSPDGHEIVFAATSPRGRPILWLRSLKDLDARRLPQTEDAEHPFWSPDGRWIGFFADGKLKKMPVSGGPPQVVAEGVPNPLGGSWGPDDTILFTSGNTPVLRVSASGSTTSPVTALDVSHQEASHRWPRFLPDGRHFLYTSRSASSSDRGIYVGALDGKTRKRLVGGVGVDSSALYVPPGYLLWLDGDTLLGQAFDAERLELSGQPLTIAERVGHATTGHAAVSASQAGMVAYAGPILRVGRLTWFDRSGEQREQVGPEGDYADFRLSPDEKRLAVSLIDPRTGGGDIWIDDLARGRSRFTYGSGPILNAAAIWSPDGSRLIFRTNRRGALELYQKSAAGGGSEEPLFAFAEDRVRGMQTNNLVSSDWSPDGQHLLFSAPTLASGSFDLWLLPLAGNKAPTSFVSAPSDQMHGNFSPDGHYVAYSSNETGRFEVYVETFPRSERKWQVSTSGGYEPRWRSDGREVYYIAEDRKLMAVSIGAGLAFGAPTALFQTRTSVLVSPFRTSYVVNRVGSRFLINTQNDDAAHIPITVVLNWTAGLHR
jgi:serine/threonine protein kinase/Tol biopolymer transport system component